MTDAGGPCGKFRFHLEPKIKVGLITLQRKRPWPSCPNPATGRQWSDDMKVAIIRILEKTPFQVFSPPEDLLVVDDASLRIALGHLEAANVDVIVACQPVISDGRLAPVLAQQWNNCLVLWATPEEQNGEMISGNSLVGTHMMAATLRQLGFDLELVYANLDWSLAEVQLLRGVHVAFATRFLAKAKLGLVGYHAPGFQDLHPDPFCMRKSFGSIMLHLDLSEYEQLAMDCTARARPCAKDIPNPSVRFLGDFLLTVKSKAIEEDVAKVLAMKWPFTSDASPNDLPTSSRHYLAIKALIHEHNLDAIAVRCWPELPNFPGIESWCYLALARLASEGFPIACEGDIDGALGGLIGKLLGCGPVYLSDWLEHDSNTVTLWHGGMAPVQICEAVGSLIGPCISRHFNNKKAGCLDATIKIGIPVTIYRFWVMDGKYKLIVLEGKTLAPKRHLLGNNGLVEISNYFDLIQGFQSWIQNGFPHHVCVVPGHHGNVLASLAQHCKVEVLTKALN